MASLTCVQYHGTYHTLQAEGERECLAAADQLNHVLASGWFYIPAAISANGAGTAKFLGLETSLSRPIDIWGDRAYKWLQPGAQKLAPYFHGWFRHDRHVVSCSQPYLNCVEWDF